MFKKRLKDESSASLTYIGICAIVLLIFLGIFLVDITKDVYIVRQYQVAAQKATQVGIKEQNAYGGLKPSAAQKALDEYKIQTSLKDSDQYKVGRNIGAFSKNCRPQGDYPKVVVYFDTGRHGRGGKVEFSSNKFSQMPKGSEQEFIRKNYRILGMEVVDAVDNMFTGIFTYNKGSCKEIHLSASSIASSSYDSEKQFEIIEYDKP